MILLLASLCLVIAASTSNAASIPKKQIPCDPQRTGFKVRYQKEITDYKDNAVFLMPGEILKLEVLEKIPRNYRCEFKSGQAMEGSNAYCTEDPIRTWSWKVPDSAGVYPIDIHRDMGNDSMKFNVFVMVPASELKGEYLKGYRIGNYPETFEKSPKFYEAPRGYIKLDSKSAHTKVSPHFRLDQFVCKQSANFPAYLFLKERPILKLEWMLERANYAGYRCSTFNVMSGYRTPFYNRLIGNVRNSAHQFGGAADILIDENPADGEMDDLNQDGKLDEADVDIFVSLADTLTQAAEPSLFIGGTGKYLKSRWHPSFVHVDVRGFRALW